MLRPQKYLVETEKSRSHEIEPNLSKDRAMHEGDHPSFSN
jgi:hypothetical protein